MLPVHSKGQLFTLHATQVDPAGMCLLQVKEHQAVEMLLIMLHYSLSEYMASATQQAGQGVKAFMHRLRTIRLPQV